MLSDSIVRCREQKDTYGCVLPLTLLIFPLPKNLYSAVSCK